MQRTNRRIAFHVEQIQMHLRALLQELRRHSEEDGLEVDPDGVTTVERVWGLFVRLELLKPLDPEHKRLTKKKRIVIL